MTYDPMSDADACRRRWPEQRFATHSGTATPRAACMTCGCYTLPVRIEAAAGETAPRVRTPERYPCPVCGQIDQYAHVWISARARHHAHSRRSLRELGFVTLEHGPLREARPEERPSAPGTPLRAPSGGPLFVQVDDPPATRGCMACHEARRREP